MPNNKGFAISSVLYLLLVAFLMFLMLMLAQFTSSTSIIGKANDDLVNGSKFEAMQIKDSNKRCIKVGNSKQANDIYWYESGNGELLVRIKSRYGTMYWPKDFGLELKQDGGRYFFSGEDFKITRNIKVECLNSTGGVISCNNYFLDKKEEPIKIDLESSDEISISKENYDSIKSIIEQIESYESRISTDTSVFGSISYYTKVSPSNIKTPEGFSYEDYQMIEDNNYEELFDVFNNFLKELESPNNDVIYSYNEDTYIFTTTDKKNLSIELEYYPVIYKIDIGVPNKEVIYFDLVPSNELSTDDAKTLYENGITISGADIDRVLLKDDDDPYDVNIEENTKLFKDFKEISTTESESYYASLKITDNISDKPIFLKLYDICQ